MERPLADRLVITPILEPAQVGSGSVDLRLGTEFLLRRRTHGAGLDPGEDLQSSVDLRHERIVVPVGETLWLHPQDFVLASTLEFIRLPCDLGASVNARSSWGRLGLVVATAIFVHPGYAGCLTLELVNEGNSPIALYPGLPIAQLAIQQAQSPTGNPYPDLGQYVSPTRPQAAKIEKDQAKIKRLQLLRERLSSRLGQPQNDETPV